MRWAGYVARTGEMRNTYKILVGKSEWKMPLEKHKNRREDKIEVDLKRGMQVYGLVSSDSGFGAMAFVNTVMKLRFPLNTGYNIYILIN
jgi:hypothetical protein